MTRYYEYLVQVRKFYRGYKIILDFYPISVEVTLIEIYKTTLKIKIRSLLRLLLVGFISTNTSIGFNYAKTSNTKRIYLKQKNQNNNTKRRLPTPHRNPKIDKRF